MANTQIWVPIGLPLVEEQIPTGLRFVNRPVGVVLTFDYFPEFNLLNSFNALQYKMKREGANIYYSKLYKDQFFVFSYSDGSLTHMSVTTRADGAALAFPCIGTTPRQKSISNALRP